MDEAEALEKLKKELKRVKDELDKQAKTLKETDDAIKVFNKELEEKNRELQKLHRLKSEYRLIISNELKAPLMSIKNVANLLPMIWKGHIGENEMEFFKIITKNTDIMIRLVDDLLDVCKIEAGEFVIRREPVHIVDLAKKVIASFIPQAKEKGIELRERFLIDSAIEIYLDGQKIIRVFTNLISNALRFTEKGYIEISIEDKNEIMECYVSDTSRGISEENLPNVFDKFQQFDRVASPEMKGLGLSLSIVKGIVELHKGNIWVESKLNEGTKFTFTLLKYTVREAIGEYVASNLEDAKRNKSYFSVVKLEFENFDDIQKEIGKGKSDFIRQNLEELIKNNIRQQTDATFKTANAILAVVPTAKRKDAIIITERLQQSIHSYLSHEKLDKKIKIGCKLASFPEDGSSYKKYLLE